MSNYRRRIGRDSDALAHGLSVHRPGAAPVVGSPLQNSVAWYDAQDVTSVIANGALNFSAPDNQFLQVDAAPVTIYPFTLLSWFKTSRVANQTTIFIGDKDDGARYQAIEVRSTGVVHAVSRDSVGSVFAETAASTYLDDNWHLVAAMMSSPTSRIIRIDGEIGVEATDNVPITATYDRTTIGRFGDLTPSNTYGGEIAQSGIYNRALTAQEFLDLFNNGTVVDFATVVPSGLVSRWFLNDPAAPYLDLIGGLDLAAFGDVGEPTPVLGPNTVQAVEGASISEVKDVSDNSNNITQPTPANRPEYVKVPWADGFRRAMRFDGVDDFLSSVTPLRDADPVYRYILCRFIDPTSGVAVILLREDSGSGIMLLGKNASDLVRISVSTTQTGTIATGNFELMKATYDNLTSSLERNSVVDASGAIGALLTQAGITLAAAPGNTSNANCDILEVIDVDTDLDPTLTDYFRDKYLLFWGDTILTGPTAWLSASSIENTTADDGSGEDVGDTDPVGFWVDVSGNGNSGIQATTIDKPIFDLSNSGFSNKPVIAFDGTNFISVDGLADDLSGTDQAATYFLVFDSDVSIQDGIILQVSGTSGVDPVIELARLTADGKLSFTKDDGVTPSTLLTDSDWGNAPAILVIKDIGTAITFLRNGVEIGTGTVNTGALTGMTQFRIGSKGGASGSLVGNMSQLIVWPSRTLSNTEIDRMGNYLGGFYGIAWIDVV